MKTAYPVTFSVDFPDRHLDRLTGRDRAALQRLGGVAQVPEGTAS